MTQRITRRLAARAFRAILVAALTATTIPGTHVSAFASDAVVNVGSGSTTINLGLNKTKVIVLSADAHDVLVANPRVADAVTRDARRIYLFGKQIGQTNIVVFDRANRQIASIDVVIERDISGLAESIRKFVPSANVEIDMINDNVVLTGTAQTPQDASRVEELAQIFVTGGEGTTGQYIQSATSAGTNEGSVAFAQEGRRSSQIVNLIQIQGEDQVTLKVTVAEVQRSVIKQLGLDSVTSTAVDGVTFGLTGDNPFGLGKAISSSGARLAGAIGSTGISAQLTALNQAGVMRTLAEPSLTAISGESASFRVGGEFVLPDGKSETIGGRTPILDAAGNIVGYDDEPDTYEYENRRVEYGIGLDFTPVVLSPGRISLRIKTSVSEPAFESPFNIPSGVVPAVNITGLKKRLAETSVELPSGGSLVIAGLVRDEVRQVISGYPGLSSLPILGTLFRSRDFQRYETELVIIVTPYLVRPVARDELARPDDGFGVSSDGSANFLGRLNRVYGHAETDLPPGRYHGVVGFIYK